jgi:capsular exopolysaccharide synthesis family protein
MGGVIAFVLYFITDRISTPDDVREKLRLPPIGVIPRLKRKEELAEVIADRKSPISEAYASLVTTLQFTTSEGLPRALLVTSTIAEEGKSTSSFVIARMMAQNGLRTLLVDADLRKPSFVVEESVDTGFSQLVIDGSELQRHVIKTSEDNLWLMPSGPMPPNPVQVLNSDRARRVIRQARELFDCVIVDAPPAYGFADAPLLATMCDAVLLVVESGRTRRRPAVEAIERLRSSGALIVGANLTKYKFDTSEYGYRYYEAYDENRVALRPHELAVGLIKRSGT